MPVGRLILNMSLPMMFSMFILALYNIVDSMFIAMINEEALTALSLAFPVQNLLMSFSIGTGVGVNAILSRRLGEHNQEAVDKLATLSASRCNRVSSHKHCAEAESAVNQVVVPRQLGHCVVGRADLVEEPTHCNAADKD